MMRTTLRWGSERVRTVVGFASRRAVIFAVAVFFTAFALFIFPDASGPPVIDEVRDDAEEAPEVVKYSAVYVDDDFLGYTRSAGDIQEAMDEYVRAQQYQSGFQVTPEQELIIEQKSDHDPPRITPAYELTSQVLDLLTFTTRAVGVEVDGEVVVVLKNEEKAEAVLQSLEDSYVDSLQVDDKTEVLDSEFMQDIQLVSKPADPDSIVDPEQAEEILVRGTDRTEVHEVQGGETAWGIAQAADLSVGDLEKANPDKDVSRLHPGDEVELVVADPHVTLRSEEESWYIRHVSNAVETRESEDLWPWEQNVIQAGRPGEVKVTVRIERESGQEIGREIIEEEELSEPVTHIVEKGTRTVPQHGSGRFILPASGELTSGFGWRGTGFHSGIDLAMPVGTPIKAADCGMVTSAGRSGAYGIKMKVDHGEGEYVTVYAHLSQTSASVGDVVEQGQVIGYSGNTGRSTGPHLHFEIRVNGQPKNPLDFFRD